MKTSLSQAAVWRGAALLVTLASSSAAQAHVKWFCGVFDPTVPPVPLREVLSATFLRAAPLFMLLVAAGAYLDGMLARTAFGSAAKFRGRDAIGEVILRVGLSTYAFCLWANLAVVMWADSSEGSILTPELLRRGPVLAGVQLGLGVMVLIPRASILAGAALALLYGAGVVRYGAFYMIDYLFFLGAAAYLAMSDPRLRRFPRVAVWRLALLAASISVSLMWTAVEKFLFPQWTMTILIHHSGITAGFAIPTVTTIAGFIEFSLAFYVLVGRDILIRVSIAALMALFTLAMPEFGMVDVVGHIPLIAIFLVLILHGETPLQRQFRRGHSSILASGGRVAMLYAVTLVGMIAIYDGLHAISVAA